MKLAEWRIFIKLHKREAGMYDSGRFYKGLVLGLALVAPFWAVVCLLAWLWWR